MHKGGRESEVFTMKAIECVFYEARRELIVRL